MNAGDRPHYPPGTRLIGYRWFDPHADDAIHQGPVIVLRVYRDPNMRQPERLAWQLRAALADVLSHLDQEFPHGGESGSTTQ
jgi:hypothetical protein